jgi:transposase
LGACLGDAGACPARSNNGQSRGFVPRQPAGTIRSALPVRQSRRLAPSRKPPFTSLTGYLETPARLIKLAAFGWALSGWGLPIGRSRGGLTTKIMALVDALGNLIRFVLLPGQRHDSIGVEPLITGLDFEALIGDKAFDNNWLRANLNERGAAAVIPSKADRAGRIPHDAEMYKWRHLVENFFCQLKAFRRIATRYEKTDACFAGFLNLVALFLACR